MIVVCIARCFCLKVLCVCVCVCVCVAKMDTVTPIQAYLRLLSSSPSIHNYLVPCITTEEQALPLPVIHLIEMCFK
jgi:hypothetical protein